MLNAFELKRKSRAEPWLVWINLQLLTLDSTCWCFLTNETPEIDVSYAFMFSNYIILIVKQC